MLDHFHIAHPDNIVYLSATRGSREILAIRNDFDFGFSGIGVLGFKVLGRQGILVCSFTVSI